MPLRFTPRQLSELWNGRYIDSFDDFVCLAKTGKPFIITSRPPREDGPLPVSYIGGIQRESRGCDTILTTVSRNRPVRILNIDDDEPPKASSSSTPSPHSVGGRVGEFEVPDAYMVGCDLVPIGTTPEPADISDRLYFAEVDWAGDPQRGWVEEQNRCLVPLTETPEGRSLFHSMRWYIDVKKMTLNWIITHSMSPTLYKSRQFADSTGRIIGEEISPTKGGFRVFILDNLIMKTTPPNP
jgi:hypothetical protein